MRLDSVTIHEMGPFEHFELDLTSFGDALLIAICGENGSGKSCLLEMAMPGALYRKCPTQGALLDRARARDSYVEATLTNGKTYTFRHSVDAVNRKGESLVRDEYGKPVLKSTSNKAFDLWAEEHLPKPAVLYSTVFWAQKKEGFIGESEGGRKAVLLRALGIERYEALAAGARDHATAVTNELDTLRARIEDERKRGGNVQFAEMAVTLNEDEAAKAFSVMEDARRALEIGRAEQPALELERAKAKMQREKRLDLDTRIKAKTAELANLDMRIANNKAVLVEADVIRTAKARSDELVAEGVRLEEQINAAKERMAAATREVEEHTKAVRAAGLRKELALARKERQEKRLADRAQIEEAVGKLPEAERVVEQARAATAAAETTLEAVRAERLAGADERIESLRTPLRDIGDADDAYDDPCERLADVADLARTALATDDARVTAATQLPARLAATETAVRDARKAEQDATRALEKVRALATRAGEIETAERDLVGIQADLDIADMEAVLAARKRDEATAAFREHDTHRTAAVSQRDTAKRELDQLAPTAAKAGPLEHAKGRLAELEPQRKTVADEIEQLKATLEATPEPPEQPAPPAIATLEEEVSRAELAQRQAIDAVAAARAELQTARESAEHVLELEEQAKGLEADLADWTKLALDLGRDGLQALEIDAAGPELTELINDLLRNCFGPRFSVSVETTRASSDGKRELDDLVVRVIDTEKGRDDDAKLFSGGERVILGEAASLALTMLACRRSGLEGVTLIRDESGAALDPENGRAYISMLRRAAHQVRASRVLFVTHSKELADMADARVQLGGTP